MKRLMAVALILLITTPAFPCGPMMSGGGNPKSTGMSPGREKWTRNRLQVLKGKRRAEKNKGIDLGGFIQKTRDNPLVTGDPFAITDTDRRRDAERRQKEIDTLEFLALKKERGELSPAGEEKLKALLRHIQNK